MAKLIAGNWKDYRIEGPPGTVEAPNEKCSPFSVVMHAAHVRPALDIVRDNRINWATISDKSHFANTSIRVVWVSPFDWYSGSRYGCIQFSYDWASLLFNKEIYWAEVVDYTFPACRFLITDMVYRDHAVLREYDPTDKDGPWWYDPSTGTHYQNKKVCVEFMIEQCLTLPDSCNTAFVRHSDRTCCLNKNAPHSCREYGRPTGEVGMWFLGQLLGSNLDASRLRLSQQNGDQVQPSESLISAWNQIYNTLWGTQDGYTNLLNPAHPSAPAVARSILAAIGHRNRDERTALARLFHSREDAIAACSSLIRQGFGLTGELPIGDEA